MEIEDGHAVSGGPADGLQNCQLGVRLKAALAKLAEPYRSLVILRDVQQGSYQDAAQAREDLLLALKYTRKANQSACLQIKAAINSGMTRPVTDETRKLIQQPLETTPNDWATLK